MKKYLLGKKIGMTQIMDDEGVVTPVTVVQAGPCTVVDILDEEKNGYNALLLGYEAVDASKLNKPKQGVFSKKKTESFKHLKECRIDNSDNYEANQTLDVTLFEVSEKVSVRGKTIGRGFTGTIKRHNFARGPMSHGSKSHRIPGSIGGGTYPGRVIKGKRMAGHYGDENVTIQGLEIVGVDTKRQCLLIKGAVPGKKSNLLEIFVK